jgi:hypothetical protein
VEITETTGLEFTKNTNRIASETGNFYNSLLDTYLTNELPENRNRQITQLTETLPLHMRKLYGEGIKRYQDELTANHELLVPHKGAEVQYLLGAVL